MTPKEKAEELVEMFKPFSYYDGHDLTTRKRREESNIESAVECALIAVDEIIYALNIPNWDGNYENSPKDIGDGLFWQEVKQELKQL